jgi:hypothetical protein
LSEMVRVLAAADEIARAKIGRVNCILVVGVLV